ncbi:MAG: 2Fe-2S iron-sulfur cluster-binding protein, partial [Bacteroidota bacterium]
FLLARGVGAEQVHFELFNTNGLPQKRRPPVLEDQTAESEIKIIEGGKAFTFRIPRASDNILDAALRNYADLPYACKGGVCCTCRAKLVEGEVDMEVTYGLEPEEIEKGYVLTCQAVPLTDKVVVDFDASMASSE